MEISTIHGVKGETHHATLVLETMNRVYDISSMLPWIIDPELNVPTQITKKKFMKQLYVAVTRAKHLLCMAIHTDRISPEQIQQLESLGWNVVQIE